jgi:hypothetical protein
VPEFCLVLAPGQNTFFFEIAEAIRSEMTALGQKAWISRDGWPEPRENLIFVLVPPHEYYRLEGVRVEPTWQVLKRTIFICAEQPGTKFFDEDVFLADRAGAVFDVSRVGVEEFRRRGIPGVRHLPLGWTPGWSPVDLSDPDASGQVRDIDVLHLGIFTPKRGRDLATLGPWLWHRHSRLQLADDHGPNTRALANYATGAEKWDLLARSRVLLNVHVSEQPYFEWLRVVQAIGAGAAVVTEHSVDYEPLVPGEHAIFGRPDTLGLLAQELLDDEERRFELARNAWLLLKEQRPFSTSVEALVEAGEEINANPLPPDGRSTRFRLPSLTPRPAPEFGAAGYPSAVSDPDSSAIRAALKDVRLDQLGLRRELARLRLTQQLGAPPPEVERVAETPGYAAASPRVSFITALYNHAEHIQAALDSAARSSFSDIEVVVADDGSSDGSGEAVRDWMARSEVPALLMRHPVNRGLGAARNTAIESARGEMVFVLDADNEVYPTAVAKLLAALERDPDAVFSYGMLEMFTVDGPVGLRSYYPWRPERFRETNYIDAMALIRRDWLLANGGYTTDVRLHGWEDYDLWCRIAERGGHGVMVPEIVARYRSALTSMLSLTDISRRQAVALLIERHPRLMAGVQVPL